MRSVENTDELSFLRLKKLFSLRSLGSLWSGTHGGTLLEIVVAFIVGEFKR